MSIIARILSNAAGLAAAAWLLDDMRVDGADWQAKLPTLLVTAVIFALVTSLVKPVVTMLSFPLVLLTLGLFLLVINTLMLLLTGWIADKADVGFYVEGFWTALVASIVITVVTSVVTSTFFKTDD
jgi:putative membrane protein